MNRASVSVFLLLVMASLGGCGPKDAAPGGKGAPGNAQGGGAGQAPTLTAEMLPKDTRLRPFVTRRFLVNKDDKKVTYKEGAGCIHVTTDDAFVASNKLAKDVKVIRLSEKNTKGELVSNGAFRSGLRPFRQSAEGVEFLLNIYPTQTWATFVKKGAKPGDKWDSDDKSQARYRLKCTYLKSEGCAVIETVSYEDKRPLEMCRWYLSPDKGIMRLDIHGSGKKEASNLWIPLMQYISDDWTGDKSPLVLEDLKK